MSAGRKLRDLELDLFEKAKHPGFVKALRAYAHAWCHEHGQGITTDQLWGLAQRIGFTGHPSAMGAVFRGSAGWTLIRYVESSRPSRHAGKIGLWMPTDMVDGRAAA